MSLSLAIMPRNPWHEEILNAELLYSPLKIILTGTPQGLYNWAACDVTNPNLSSLLSLTFQVISGTPQIFR